MAPVVRIGLIGDCSPAVVAHDAIPRALALASAQLGCEVATTWLPTARLGALAAGAAPEKALAGELRAYHGLWCVPGSPYQDMDGALAGIRFAREQGVPFLGTCGGFQHAVLEYFRNVLGVREADHVESNPAAELPVIAPLACALVGTSGTIVLLPDSRVGAIYGQTEIVEAYHCSFGFSAAFEPMLADGALRITGRDERGEARVIELAGHPLFIGTLFQPERSALAGRLHPLIVHFLRAAALENRR
jgi:CTP synthase (UTP-ammonia lyase)